MMLLRTIVAGCALGVLGACSTDGACTEIGCDDEAQVTFPPTLVTGPFDLTIRDGQGGTANLAARCGDPAAIADNPPEITCDATGFTIVGHELAQRRELAVTIVDDAGDTLADAVAVALDVVDERRPNGEGCPPACFVRNGQLVVTGMP